MKKKERNAGRGVLALGDIYTFIYCMLLSMLLLRQPVVGAALYLCGRTLGVAARVRGQLLFSRRRMAVTTALWVLLLCNIALLMLMPLDGQVQLAWLVFGIVLCIHLRDVIGHRLCVLCVGLQLPEKRFLPLYIGMQLLFVVPVAALLLILHGTADVWSLLGGFALSSLLCAYTQMKERYDMRPEAPDAARRAAEGWEKLRGAYSYRLYTTMSVLIQIAAQLTLVTIFVFLAFSAEQVLISLTAALVMMVAAWELSDLLLRRLITRKRLDPGDVLLPGLALWLVGVFLFARMLASRIFSPVNACVQLGLCSAGTAVCQFCLREIDARMRSVALFASEEGHEQHRRLRRAADDAAVFIGQLLSLAAVTVLNLMQRQPEGVTLRLQPWLAVPALLLVIASMITAIRFPVSDRIAHKLAWFLHIREEGDENAALMKQLKDVLIDRHRRPFGISLIIMILRPLLRHRLIHEENVHADDDNPIVFLGNHGEIYGPVAFMLYLPVPVRPWTIAELVVGKEEFEEYVYKYAISPVRWIPEGWKRPLTRLLGRVSVWGMAELESIPVYRNQPSRLMRTFKASAEALEAGDNLLIFPENPDADPDDRGYDDDRMKPFFDGFALIAQMYYRRTGRRCRFMPVYAHQKNRTITFGTEIVYQPDTGDEAAERKRISDEAEAQMRRLCAEENARSGT